jgi:hypothetical protein
VAWRRDSALQDGVVALDACAPPATVKKSSSFGQTQSGLSHDSTRDCPLGARIATAPRRAVSRDAAASTKVRQCRRRPMSSAKQPLSAESGRELNRGSLIVRNDTPPVNLARRTQRSADFPLRVLGRVHNAGSSGACKRRTVTSMGTFVPRGQAGEESQRVTREEEMKAGQRRALQDSEQPKRPSLIKRILRKLRRAQ